VIDHIYCALIRYGISVKHAGAIRRRLRHKPNTCVVWYGAHTGKHPVWGYTKAKKGVHFRLHRLIYCAVNNVELGKEDILHARCYFDGCCNPDHRYVDSRAAMNASKPTRSKNLDWERVRMIRSAQLSDAAYAKWFGVARSTVTRVRLNQTWRYE
jgi:hypothetical protein